MEHAVVVEVVVATVRIVALLVALSDDPVQTC